nr:YbhB/YbcL family Raf kinase inhibitor-like protein [Rhodococcus sp. (in: high G+C Gram-positive bacteria)]
MIGKLLRNVRAGDTHSVRHQLEHAQTIDVTSDAFADGQPMPATSAGTGAGPNISPPLQWSGLPPATRQLVLAIEDVDVPLPRPILHTVALIDPDVTGLAENGLTESTLGVRFVPASFKRLGYHGPRPVPGHGPHRYAFHLAALDCVLDAETTKGTKLGPLVSGHVIGYGSVTGTYERP